MNIEKFHIYLADLNPAFGTEPGKVRPVVVVQTNILNNLHQSTIICPLTTKIQESYLLRVRVFSKDSGLSVVSDIMVDQITAIDNRRFKRYLGRLNDHQAGTLLENIKHLIFE